MRITRCQRGPHQCWPLKGFPWPRVAVLSAFYLCSSLHSQDSSTLYISFTPKGTKVHHVRHIYQV